MDFPGGSIIGLPSNRCNCGEANIPRYDTFCNGLAIRPSGESVPVENDCGMVAPVPADAGGDEVVMRRHALNELPARRIVAQRRVDLDSRWEFRL